MWFDSIVQLQSRAGIEITGIAYPRETLSALRGFLAREIAESIVLGFGVAAVVVVEGWIVSLVFDSQDA
jgi:hypothetical protein